MISNSISTTLVSKILGSIIVVVLTIIIKNIGNQIIKKQFKSNRAIYKWKRISTNTIHTLALISLAIIWLTGIKSFTTFLGILTAGLAFALKDIIADMAGYIFILLKKPIEIGDRVEIGEAKGDILNIDWFQITLLEIGNWVDSDQSTGRLIFVPTATILSGHIYNYSSGFDWIWNEISVLITFESDWKQAKKIMHAIIKKEQDSYNGDLEKGLKKAMQVHLIEFKNTEPIIYTKAVDSGIQLQIRYLVQPKSRRLSEHHFWEKFLETCDKDKTINLAYPTVRHIK